MTTYSLHAASLLLVLLAVAADSRAPLETIPAPPDPAESGHSGPPLLRPFDGTPRLTSNFGEYRAGHYHAGLDYSTGGRVGAAVHAPADGWVWRTRVSGSGYGRALYFRLDDGRTVVFAHLSRFAPAVERAAREEQDRRGEYEVDFRPPRDALRFARGDTLAWSGESGAGPPHLHAEVRIGEEADIAVQPLGEGWNVADAVPPELTRLRVAPAGPESWVGGGREPIDVDFADTAAVVCVGPLELHVETLDRAVDGGNRLATYHVAAGIDGRPFADVRLDRLDWRRPAEVRWTYLEQAARERSERWVALGPPPASAQSVHRRLDGGKGPLLVLPPGDHRLRVTAADFAGRSAERSAVLRVLEAPDPSWGPRVPLPRFLSRGRFLEVRLPAGGGDVWVRDPAGRLRDPAWLRFDGAAGTILSLDRPEPPIPGLWTFGLAGDSSVVGRALWVDPASGSSAVARLEEATVEVPGSAVYEPVWIGVTLADTPPPEGVQAGELAATGPMVVLTPSAWPLRGTATVSFPDAPEGATVMSLRSGWSFEGGERTKGGVEGEIGNLESVAALRDLGPPRIAWVSPAAGAAVDSLPDLVARVADPGSGVTWRTLGMRLDGEPVIAEWDPEAGRYRAHLRAPLAPGPHEARVTATDRAGNRAEATVTFRVR